MVYRREEKGKNIHTTRHSNNPMPRAGCVAVPQVGKVVASLRIISPGLQFTLSLAAGGGGRCLVPSSILHACLVDCGLWIVWTVLRGCCAASGLVHFTGAHSALDLSGRGCPGRQPPPLSIPRSFFGLFFFSLSQCHSAQLNPVRRYSVDSSVPHELDS